MNLKHSVWEKAKKITMMFEGTDVIPITGNFDGMFLSMGMLQWNLGMGTLQPMLSEFFNNNPALTTQLGLDDFKNALHSGTEKDFAKHTLNNSGTHIVEPWKTRLINMCNTDEWKALEMKYSQWYINTAASLCQGYNITTDRAFCLFFDIAVQNGSIPVIQLAETQYLDKLNAIAQYTAERANSQWRSDVLERKQAIVYCKNMGRGWNSSIVFDEQSAFGDDFEDAVHKFVNKGIIGSPDYWMQNCVEGRTVEGEYIHAIILRFVAMYKIVDTFEEAVDVLHDMAIINSPDYWKANAVQGQTVEGIYARSLIMVMATKF